MMTDIEHKAIEYAHTNPSNEQWIDFLRTHVLGKIRKPRIVYPGSHYFLLAVITVLPFLFGVMTGYGAWKLTYAAPRALQSPKTIIREPSRDIATISATLSAGASATLTPSPTKRPPSKWGTATAQYLNEVFGKDAAWALETARKESKLDCQHIGKGNSKGLFGITPKNEYRYSDKDIKDCYVNIDIAKQIYDQFGKEAWN